MQTATQCKTVQKSFLPSTLVRGENQASLLTSVNSMDVLGLTWIFTEDEFLASQKSLK
ncbi:MAG: hypothetical protein HKM23_09490 [Nitrosopumilus sp.]|nr:hypothetical protein [Nitrosopumilus sp.]NNL57860.1 hypothetical protein [Nitrosopumilus sp.]